MGAPPRIPKPDAAPALPNVTDPSVQAQAEKQRLAEVKQRGISGTILTGASGVEDTSVKKKTLLGG